MGSLLLQPIVTNLSKAGNNADQFRDLWKLFTKVKDSMQGGRRLENLFWRLWYDKSNGKLTNTNKFASLLEWTCNDDIEEFPAAVRSKKIPETQPQASLPIAQSQITIQQQQSQPFNETTSIPISVTSNTNQSFVSTSSVQIPKAPSPTKHIDTIPHKTSKPKPHSHSHSHFKSSSKEEKKNSSPTKKLVGFESEPFRVIKSSSSSTTSGTPTETQIPQTQSTLTSKPSKKLASKKKFFVNSDSECSESESYCPPTPFTTPTKKQDSLFSKVEVSPTQLQSPTQSSHLSSLLKGKRGRPQHFSNLQPLGFHLNLGMPTMGMGGTGLGGSKQGIGEWYNGYGIQQQDHPQNPDNRLYMESESLMKGIQLDHRLFCSQLGDPTSPQDTIPSVPDAW